MRPRLALLFCWTALLLLPSAASWGQTSEKMRARIMATLPKFAPPTGETKAADSPVGTPAPLSDDPVVRLPVFEVIDRRGPASSPDAWLDKKALKEKAYKEYKDSMTPLEWMLNCFYIPFATPSPQARADDAYQEKKLAAEMNHLSNVINVISRIDPADAKKLEREMDLSRHPGN